MAKLWDNSAIDSFNSDNIEYIRVQSSFYGGNYDSLTVPATVNFPKDTPTKYFLKFLKTHFLNSNHALIFCIFQINYFLFFVLI